jgi:membrane-associated protease RseP (regulator of RpoE activity)
MSEIPTPDGTSEAQPPQPFDFDRIITFVSAEFQVEESLIESGIPTYYLKQPQETKQPFLRLLKNLEPLKLIAFLRRTDGNRVALKIVSKPVTKPSNIMINWILFFATIVTTFVTGYLISGDMMDPLVGGAAFTIAIMTVLGAHEMGHKITANRKGMDATPPYFIPGPPPVGDFLGIGTFGAVIMQKSLPPNKDSLFDIGASGPLVGFVLAMAATIIGMPLSKYSVIPENSATFLPPPLLFSIIGLIFPPAGPVPHASAGYVVGISLHPIAFAGWVGLIVTMLNILPAAMLDGGHVARALLGDKARLILTGLSILVLVVTGFLPMALFVVFLAMYRHPGPLDDVSRLSSSRKLLAVLLVVVFVLSSWVYTIFFYLLQLLGI